MAIYVDRSCRQYIYIKIYFQSNYLDCVNSKLDPIQHEHKHTLLHTVDRHFTPLLYSMYMFCTLCSDIFIQLGNFSIFSSHLPLQNNSFFLSIYLLIHILRFDR